MDAQACSAGRGLSGFCHALHPRRFREPLTVCMLPNLPGGVSEDTSPWNLPGALETSAYAPLPSPPSVSAPVLVAGSFLSPCHRPRFFPSSHPAAIPSSSFHPSPSVRSFSYLSLFPPTPLSPTHPSRVRPLIPLGRLALPPPFSLHSLPPPLARHASIHRFTCVSIHSPVHPSFRVSIHPSPSTRSAPPSPISLSPIHLSAHPTLPPRPSLHQTLTGSARCPF